MINCFLRKIIFYYCFFLYILSLSRDPEKMISIFSIPFSLFAFFQTDSLLFVWIATILTEGKALRLKDTTQISKGNFLAFVNSVLLYSSKMVALACAQEAELHSCLLIHMPRLTKTANPNLHLIQHQPLLISHTGIHLKIAY